MVKKRSKQITEWGKLILDHELKESVVVIDNQAIKISEGSYPFDYLPLEETHKKILKRAEKIGMSIEILSERTGIPLHRLKYALEGNLTLEDKEYLEMGMAMGEWIKEKGISWLELIKDKD